MRMLCGLLLGLMVSVIAADPGLCAPTARELVSQGNRLISTGKGDEALEIFEKALVREPESPLIHYNLGCAHFLREDYDQAIEYFEKAALRTKDIDLETRAIYNIGNCSFRKGQGLLDADLEDAVAQLSDAVGRYRKVLDRKEGDPDALHNIQVVKLLIKELQDRLRKEQEEKEKNKEDEEKQKSIPERIKEIMIDQHKNLMRTRTAYRGMEAVDVLREVISQTKEDAATLRQAPTLGGEERDAFLMSEQKRREKVLSSVQRLGQIASGFSEETTQKLAEPLQEFLDTTLQAQEEAAAVLKSTEKLQLEPSEEAELDAALVRLDQGISEFEEQIPEMQSMLASDVDSIKPDLAPKQAELDELTGAVVTEMEQIIQGMLAQQEAQASGAVPGAPPGAPPGGPHGAPQGQQQPVDPEVLDAFQNAMPHVQLAKGHQATASSLLMNTDLVGSQEPQQKAVEELQKALEKFPKNEDQEDQEQQDQSQDQNEDQQDQEDQQGKEDQQDQEDQQGKEDQEDPDHQQNQDEGDQGQGQPEPQQARPPEKDLADKIIGEERDRRRSDQAPKQRGQYRRVDKDW